MKRNNKDSSPQNKDHLKQTPVTSPKKDTQGAKIQASLRNMKNSEAWKFV
jgi:hypothetical protein